MDVLVHNQSDMHVVKARGELVEADDHLLDSEPAVKYAQFHSLCLMIQGSQKPDFNRVVLERAAGLKHQYHSPLL